MMRGRLALAALLIVSVLATQHLSSEQKTDSIPKLPVYLGVGYNLVKGNPLENHVDQGFAHPIYKIRYQNNETTTDNRYLVPDNMTHRVVSSCSFASAVSEHRGTKSYKRTLQSNVKVRAGWSIGIFEGSFSLSNSYKQMEDSTINEKMSLTHATAECEAYHLEVDYFKDYALEESFEEAVNNSFNANNWDTFIEVYGTHFIKDVTMGGRALQEISYSSQSVSKMSTLYIDTVVAAKARYAFFFGDTSVDVKKYQEQIKYSETLETSSNQIYIGGHPPKDGNVKTWTNEVISNPMPIRYSAIELTQLFDKVSIANIQSNLSKVKNSFADALTAYCIKIGCKKVIDDLPKPPPAKVELIHSTDVGGSGGGPFSWASTNPMVNVKKFLVYSGGNVDIIQIEVSDGVKLTYSPQFGVTKTKYSDWTVPDGQEVTQVEFSSDKYVRGFNLITNKGVKSPRFGSTGGNYKLVSFPDGYRLVGVFGHSGTTIDRLGFILGKTTYQKSEEKQSGKDIIKTDDGQDMQLLKIELA